MEKVGSHAEERASTPQPLKPTPSVVSAFGFSATAEVVPIAGGLINQTFLLQEGGRRVVLQRLNSIFAPEVNLDIDAITTHLEKKGLLTPRVLPTRSGTLWTRDTQGGVWRALSWLDGHTLHSVDEPASARAAGQLVARFHQAVAELAHSFHFTRPGAHDLQAHLAHLRQALAAHPGHPSYPLIAVVAEAILRHASTLPPLPAVPRRLIHGDLKISNILFDASHTVALALLDLDTMAHLTIPIELGDALRSWCNPAGEDEGRASFRADIFEAAIAGYAEAAPFFLTAEERGSLVLGAETVALELSARFCADALEESYFGWNPAAFPSRSEHNRIRARSQLSVAASVRSQRAELERIVAQHFA